MHTAPSTELTIILLKMQARKLTAKEKHQLILDFNEERKTK